MSRIDDEALKMPYIIFKRLKIPSRVSYNKSYWIGNKFFKYAPDSYYRNATGFIVGELYVSELCKRIGVPCAEYKYAINRFKTFEQRGVLSKSFLAIGEKEISILDMAYEKLFSKLPKDFLFKLEMIYSKMEPKRFFTEKKDINHMVTVLLDDKHPRRIRLLPIEKKFLASHKPELEYIREGTVLKNVITTNGCIRAICEYVSENGLCLEGDLRYSLQQIAIIDAITRQHDRHAGNISIIYNEKTGKARVAPLYDNGLCGPFYGRGKSFAFPQETLCYLKLMPKDYAEIADETTPIGMFYKKVKSLDKKDFDDIANYLKSICGDPRLARSDFLTKRYGELYECGIDDSIWNKTYLNYKQGIEYIDSNIEGFKQAAQQPSEFLATF